jgi:hypothetical protein
VKEGVSARLCRSIEAMSYEDLPPAVVETVKRLVLDVLGLIGGGASAPGIPELNARLSRWEAAGSATGLVGKRRYSPPTAALANGAAAHALDFDDLHDRARVHTSAIMLPTLLAAAEDIGGVSGRQFILAMAIGAELHARFGLACYNSLAKGWHPTMVFGTLSAGIAAGKMLLLNGEGLGNALGMAFHRLAAPPKACAMACFRSASAPASPRAPRCSPLFSRKTVLPEHDALWKATPGSSPCTNAARRIRSSFCTASARPGRFVNTASSLFQAAAATTRSSASAFECTATVSALQT